MIFVTVGTQDKGFPRLFKAVQNQIDKGVIKEEVIAQIGYTKFESKDMKVFNMTSSFEEYNKYLDDARIIITHGGIGSILDGLRREKTVIAVPRLKRYKENTNDHQTQIIEKFTKENYIIGINKVSELGKAIKKAKTFKPAKYKSDNKKIINTIESFIDKI